MSVELRELKWAIAVAQHKSLRQAADALNIRQSTLSRQLTGLERRLGAVLFERTTGGTRPTAIGQEFIETALRIVAETESALARLRTRCRGETGRLRLGIYSSLSAGNLRATLIEYRRRFPDVDVQTVDGGHNRLLEDLATNTIDIAIMTHHQRRWPDKALPLWSERIVAALPEAHPLGERYYVHWSELANERMLFPAHGKGPELESLMLSKLHAYHQNRILRHEAGLDRLLSLVGAGYGATLLLEGATGIQCDGVAYREVHDDNGPTRLNFMAYWRRANSNPTLPAFLNILRERYPDLSAEDSLD